MAKETKETKEKTKKSPLVLISVLMTVCMSLLFVSVIILTNPEATKLVKNISFFKEKEYYSKPIEILAEVKDKNGEKHFIQASITVSSPKKKALKKIDEQTIKLNDLYIRYLSTKPYEELETLEGQEKVKNDLKEAVAKLMDIEIKGVYFTKWVTQ